MRFNFNFRTLMMGKIELLPPGEAYIVDTTVEFNNATSEENTPPTQQEIFNSWARFGNNPQEFFPSGTTPTGEAATWTYNSTYNLIQSTVNSATHIGFISNESYDYYTHEVDISSESMDDDMIGIIIAFYRDVENNVNRSIVACRTMSTAAAIPNPSPWSIYNINNNTGGILVDGRNKITTLYLGGSINPGTDYGWGRAGYVKIKVERNGRNIRITTSQAADALNNPNAPATAGPNPLDLNTTLEYTIPESSVFNQPLPYGYSCWSQSFSSFRNIKITGVLDASTIYDIRNLPPKVWKYNSGWNIDNTANMWEELGYPRLITNPSTNKTYFLDGPTPYSIVRVN